METLKTLFEYSVDFNRGFQGFSMANQEKGYILSQVHQNIWYDIWFFYNKFTTWLATMHFNIIISKSTASWV